MTLMVHFECSQEKLLKSATPIKVEKKKEETKFYNKCLKRLD